MKKELINTPVIDIIEESETIFVLKKIVKNKIASIKKHNGEKDNKIPVVHATPLPPLNFANIGKI